MIMKENRLQDGVKCCPFCGGPAITTEESIAHTQAIGLGEHAIWRVECQNPECVIKDTKGFLTEESAIETWNKRAEVVT